MIRGREDLLEEGLAVHSSTLAWQILWTEEPDGLQSRGSKELDMPERLSTHTCLSYMTEEKTRIIFRDRLTVGKIVIKIMVAKCLVQW